MDCGVKTLRFKNFPNAGKLKKVLVSKRYLSRKSYFSSSCSQIHFDRNDLESTRTFRSFYADFSSNQLKTLKIDVGTQTLHISDNLIEAIESTTI